MTLIIIIALSFKLIANVNFTMQHRRERNGFPKIPRERLAVHKIEKLIIKFVTYGIY